MTYRKLDITGRVFGKLTALRAIPEKRDRGNVVWLFKCECGSECEIGGSFVTKGDRRSCGCDTRTIPEAPPSLIDKYLKTLTTRRRGA